MQTAHMPPLAFVPWMLTDDPYFLEVAQATVNYGILESNINRNGEKLPRSEASHSAQLVLAHA